MKKEITREIMENLLRQGLSFHKMAKEFGYSGPGIRKLGAKWGLVSNYKSIQERVCIRTDTHKQCPKCKEIKPLDNFDKRPNGNIQSYCRICLNENRYSLIKQRKLIILNELGNKCSKCGYNKNSTALEFHHVIPSEKEFEFGKTTRMDKIRKEVEKCILVCSNCHKEIHYPQNNMTEITSKDVDSSSVELNI